MLNSGRICDPFAAASRQRFPHRACRRRSAPHGRSRSIPGCCACHARCNRTSSTVGSAFPASRLRAGTPFVLVYQKTMRREAHVWHRIVPHLIRAACEPDDFAPFADIRSSSVGLRPPLRCAATCVGRVTAFWRRIPRHHHHRTARHVTHAHATHTHLAHTHVAVHAHHVFGTVL